MRRDPSRCSSLQSRSRHAALLAALLLVACSTPSGAPAPVETGGAWPMYRGDLARDGHPAGATLTPDEATNLQATWVAHLNGAVDGTPVVSGGRVIAMSDQGEIGAFDLRTGAAAWDRRGLGSITGSAAIEGGVVLAGSLNGDVYALDLATGATRWEWTAPGIKPAVWSSPVVSRGIVMVGVGSQYGDQPLEAGMVTGLDAATGKVVWQFCVESLCKPGGGVSSSVAVDSSGRGFVGTGNPEDGVAAFDVATGTRLWAVSLHPDNGRDLDVVATPVVATVGRREVVAVGSNGGIFGVLDAATGAAVWTRLLVLGSAVHGLIASPAFDGDSFFVPSASMPSGLLALDPQTGGIRWERDTDLPVYSAPAVARDVIVFGTGDVFGDPERGALMALSTTDGAVLWSADLQRSVLSAPSIAGATVLVGDSGGALHAFRPSPA